MAGEFDLPPDPSSGAPYVHQHLLPLALYLAVAASGQVVLAVKNSAVETRPMAEQVHPRTRCTITVNTMDSDTVNTMDSDGGDDGGDAGLTGSQERDGDPPMLGRKSVLIGMLTSGFVISNAARSSDAIAGGTIEPIAATQPTYVPRWTPITAYVLGEQVVSPNNDVVSANVAHTSSAAFATDVAKWNLSTNVLTPTVANNTYVSAFKPEKYGTVGTADDTATLTAMFAAACAASAPALGIIPQVWLRRQHVVSGAATIFTLTAPVEITGTGGFKIKAANGPFEAIIGCSTHDVSGLYIHGLTFDGGNSGNPLTAGQITSYSLNNGNRMAVTFGAGTGITIANNRFTNFDCEWIINSTGTRSVKILDNTFDNIGSSNSALIHDSSTIYIDAEQVEISGNIFIAGAPGAAAAVNYGCRTAIETHCMNVSVHDNSVFNYQDGGQLSSSLWTNAYNIDWHDNHFYGVQIGIAVTSNSEMHNVSIHDNYIEIDYLTWYNTVPGSYAGGCGIQVSGAGMPAPGYIFTGLSIKDNNILVRQAALTGLTQVGVGCYSGGIVFDRSDGKVLVDRDIEITGNTITGSVDEGIHLFLYGVDGLKVCDNVIRDANTSASSGAYSYGVRLVSSGLVSNARFDRNAVIDDQTSTYSPYGNTAATVTQGYNLFPASSDNCRAYNNQMSIASGTPLFMQAAAVFDVSPPPLPTSRFFTTAHNSAARGSAYGANLASFSPVTLGVGTAVSIGCEVTTLAASSTVRLGLYRDAGGTPGTLVFDAGTVATTTAGVKTITISKFLTGGNYWLCAVPQGGSPALRVIDGGGPAGMGMPSAAATKVVNITGMYCGGYSGALPATAPAMSDGVQAYWVFLGT